jgi:hypothetical protein
VVRTAQDSRSDSSISVSSQRLGRRYKDDDELRTGHIFDQLEAEDATAYAQEQLAFELVVVVTTLVVAKC